MLTAPNQLANGNKKKISSRDTTSKSATRNPLSPSHSHHTSLCSLVRSPNAPLAWNKLLTYFPTGHTRICINLTYQAARTMHSPLIRASSYIPFVALHISQTRNIIPTFIQACNKSSLSPTQRSLQKTSLHNPEHVFTLKTSAAQVAAQLRLLYHILEFSRKVTLSRTTHIATTSYTNKRNPITQSTQEFLLGAHARGRKCCMTPKPQSA